MSTETKQVQDWRGEIDNLLKPTQVTPKHKSVLVITPDVLPLQGLATTGAGLRAWGVGQGLMAHGYDVQFAMPHTIQEKTGYRGDEAHFFKDIQTLLQEQRPDVAIFQHWPILSSLRFPYIHTILDMHGPLLLETLFQGKDVRNGFIQAKLKAMQNAQYFVCAGERQRSYFYGWLMQAGFDLREPLLEVVPFSLSPDIPEHHYPDQLTFVYGGVFLPWQDPLLGLTTLVETMESQKTGHLHFFGGNHPVYKMAPTPAFQRVQQLLNHSKAVTVSPSIPRKDLIDFYCNASVAWDVQAYNSERGMAFTSRTAEYLWAGLPVVHQAYSELGEYIRQYEAGWVVDPTDAVQMRNVIIEIMSDMDEVRRRGRNAQKLAFEKLNWEKTVTPLTRFIDSPDLYSAIRM